MASPARHPSRSRSATGATKPAHWKYPSWRACRGRSSTSAAAPAGCWPLPVQWDCPRWASTPAPRLSAAPGTVAPAHSSSPSSPRSRRPVTGGRWSCWTATSASAAASRPCCSAAASWLPRPECCWSRWRRTRTSIPTTRRCSKTAPATAANRSAGPGPAKKGLTDRANRCGWNVSAVQHIQGRVFCRLSPLAAATRSVA